MALPAADDMSRPMSSAPPSPAAQPLAPIAEWHKVDLLTFRNEIVPRHEPAVMRGLVGGWPAVSACASGEGARDYARRFDRGLPITAFVAPPEIGGRFFYGSEPNGFNFRTAETRLSTLLTELAEAEEQERPLSLYMGSTSVPKLLPGFERENRMPLLRGRGVEPRIWIGSRTRIAAHYDESENIACVVRGRRRFTVFPTDQVANLYVGPIDHTPAGQPISMVDFSAPDFERHPRFRQALAHARVADLEPGDAIYIPTLWWHHVEALDAFNILVNYWWTEAQMDGGSPLHALGHGLLTISHLPEEQREAWRALFDHFVFRRNGDPAAHIPPARRGILGASTPQLRRTIRQFLAAMLGREGP
jgi:hypothetical protein